MDNKLINERLDFIEFRQDLLFKDTELSRLLFEYRITRKQFEAIESLMEEYRENILSGYEVNSDDFEREIYNIVPLENGNFHFCEYITKSFMSEGKFEEVFILLYGHLPKYQEIC